jgi:hypothetical protein
MIELKNRDVYANGAQFSQTLAGKAINDLLSQRVDRKIGMRLRKIVRQLEQHASDVAEEHKRILEKYKKDDNGNILEKDVPSVTKEYNALLGDQAQVDGEPIDLGKNIRLTGWTWTSPIVKETGKPAKGEITLKTGDIFVNGIPFGQTSVGGAIVDILNQRVGRDFGMQLRFIFQAIQERTLKAMDEHQSILREFEPDDNGEYPPAATEKYNALLDSEFIIQCAPLDPGDDLSLSGWTWGSPIVKQIDEGEEEAVDEPVEPKKKAKRTPKRKRETETV